VPGQRLVVVRLARVAATQPAGLGTTLPAGLGTTLPAGLGTTLPAGLGTAQPAGLAATLPGQLQRVGRMVGKLYGSHGVALSRGRCRNASYWTGIVLARQGESGDPP